MLAAITEFIEQGELITQSDRKRHQYVIRSLDKNDLAAIMQLQTNVLSRIAKKEYCVPILAEEILFMLEGNGDAVGLFMQDKLYAACFLLFNVPYEINMARELSFSDEELTLVSQLELSLVHFAVRGHRLQCNWPASWFSEPNKGRIPGMYSQRFRLIITRVFKQ
ncbi:MAG: hypothetical protein ACOX5W_00285 [Bacillota bacterium]|jgi:hypothetical protein